MENASKALIIAGAILLSILIIAIGMYIYNSSQNSIATAGSQISAQEIQSFNQTWEMYEGVQTGTNVISLISKMSANAKANETESTRLPDLYCQVSKTVTDVKRVISRVTLGTTEAPQGRNNHTFNVARKAIEPRHEYRVFLIQDPNTSLINLIGIAYDSNTTLEDFTKIDLVKTAIIDAEDKNL